MLAAGFFAFSLRHQIRDAVPPQDKTVLDCVGEKAWHPRQKITKRVGGRVELAIPVADTRGIESWVFSLGGVCARAGAEGIAGCGTGEAPEVGEEVITRIK